MPLAGASRLKQQDGPEIMDDLVNLAYGMLWLHHGDDKRVHEARKLLLAAIGPDGQKDGIERARAMIGTNTPKDWGMQLRDVDIDDVRTAVSDSGRL